MKFFGLTNKERMAKLADNLGLTYTDDMHQSYKNALRDKNLGVKSIQQAVSDENTALVVGGMNFYDHDNYRTLSYEDVLQNKVQIIQSSSEKLNGYIESFIEIAGKDKLEGSVHLDKAECIENFSVHLTRKDVVVFGPALPHMGRPRVCIA